MILFYGWGHGWPDVEGPWTTYHKSSTSKAPSFPRHALRFPDTPTHGRVFPLPFYYLTGISSLNLGSHDIADKMLKVAIIADNPNPLWQIMLDIYHPNFFLT